MPTVQVPLQSWSDVTSLRRDAEFRKLAAKKVALKQQEDRVKEQLEEVNAKLYLVLDERLPEDTKSVEFDGYMLTKIDAGTSSRFDKKALLTRPLPCTGCKECKRKKVAVFVTARDIEELTTEGTRKPTVSAEKIKTKEEKNQRVAKQ